MPAARVKRILFRADAGPGIGDGHVMRCLALADGFFRSGATSILLTSAADSRAAREWSEHGHSVIQAKGDIGSSSDAENAIEAAREAYVDTVLLDGYDFSRTMFEMLRKAGLTIVAFDDTGETDPSCDLVINQNPGAEITFHNTYGQSRFALLGPRFACIRSDVLATTVVGGDGTLICFGGSVPASVGVSVARHLHRIDPTQSVTVVAPGALSLKRATDAFVAREPTNLVPYFRQADIVVTGAGVTALEALYLNLDLVVLAVAPNQEPGAAALRKSGHATVAYSPAEVASAVAELARTGKPAAPSPGTGLVDGMGPDRIHAALERIVSS